MALKTRRFTLKNENIISLEDLKGGDYDEV